MFQVVFTLLLFIFSANLHAFKFTPMSQTIELDKEQTKAVFTIENDSQEPMAIELKLRTRVMNQDGSEKQEKLSESSPLSIYPEQLIVPAAQKRSVRVTWSSEDPLTKEKSYRVVAEQLPVNLEDREKSPGIKMLLRYVAALYINPGKLKSNVQLIKHQFKDDHLILELENKGLQHQVLNKMKLLFKNKDKEHEVLASKTQGLQGENILAKAKRIFQIPLKGELSNLPRQSSLKIQWDD